MPANNPYKMNFFINRYLYILSLPLFLTGIMACNGITKTSHTRPSGPKLQIISDSPLYTPGADVVNMLHCMVKDADPAALKNLTIFANSQKAFAPMFVHILPDSITGVYKMPSVFYTPLNNLLLTPEKQIPPLLWDWHHQAEPPRSPVLVVGGQTPVLDIWFSMLYHSDTLFSDTLHLRIAQ